ncbi:MAG: DUF6520 family protein [Bacteroidota bacterium]
MKNVKRKLMMPLMVMAFAIAGAFVTNARSANAFAPEIGYAEDLVPCDTPVECSTIPSEELCSIRINGQDVQAFGKDDPEDTNCENVLYRME